jgi:hypothetical protein
MTTPKKGSTELALVAAASYALATLEAGQLRETIRENLGGSVKLADLEKIQVPGAGGTTWELPSLEGTTEAKSFAGIVIFAQDTRSYWQNEFSGDGNPPDCFSPDGILGRGNPGIACSECPYAEFGSSGNGQACKQQKVLFVVRDDGLLPAILRLPPTSLKAFRQYAARLASRGVKLNEVITTFTLEQDKNASGIKYSRVVASLGAKLAGEDLTRVRQYAAEIKPFLAAIASKPIEADASRDDGLDSDDSLETIDVQANEPTADDDFENLGKAA